VRAFGRRHDVLEPCSEGLVKVLHVEGGRNLYGGAHQILLLMRGLQARGIQNVLVCRTGSALAVAAASLGEVISLPMAGDLDVGLIHRLYRVIRSVSPDVVHLHSRIGADVMGGIACRLAGVSVVHSRRQDNPESRLAVALKYRLHDRVIAISKAIGEVLLSEGLPRTKLACVPDAIEITPWVEHPERPWLEDTFSIPPGSLVIAVIAQLIPRKGHHLLVEAMPLILKQCPDVRVLFFGRGPLESSLKALIHQREMSDRVALAGFRDDLQRILPCLDLVVHPALMEGMGVSLLQASCAGVPIVASRVGGIPEAVHEGVTGILVSPNDASALAEAIIDLLKAPERRKAMGRSGRQWVETYFSEDRMVEGNLSVYQHLLSPSQ
jgi:glycosyltransferase involved in cell wall biosynthesis